MARPRLGRVWVGAALGWLILCGLVDRRVAEDVTVIRKRHTAAEITAWRELRDPADDVAEIYGVPDPGGTHRVLLPPWDDRLQRFHPPEDPARTILFVDRALEAHLVSARVLGPSAIVGAMLLLLAGLRPRPRR